MDFLKPAVTHTLYLRVHVEHFGQNFRNHAAIEKWIFNLFAVMFYLDNTALVFFILRLYHELQKQFLILCKFL